MIVCECSRMDSAVEACLGCCKIGLQFAVCSNGHGAQTSWRFSIDVHSLRADGSFLEGETESETQ